MKHSHAFLKILSIIPNHIPFPTYNLLTDLVMNYIYKDTEVLNFYQQSNRRSHINVDMMVE